MQYQVVLDSYAYDGYSMLYHLLPGDGRSRIVDLPIVDKEAAGIDEAARIGYMVISAASPLPLLLNKQRSIGER